MVESIILNKDALLSMSFEPENSTIRDRMLNQSDLRLLEEFLVVFQCLKDITEILSGRTYVTISLIFPLLYAIMNCQNLT